MNYYFIFVKKIVQHLAFTLITFALFWNVTMICVFFFHAFFCVKFWFISLWFFKQILNCLFWLCIQILWYILYDNTDKTMVKSCLHDDQSDWMQLSVRSLSDNFNDLLNDEYFQWKIDYSSWRFVVIIWLTIYSTY